MHHTFGEMIAYASRSQTLYPGEVLGSGTAAGGSGLELDRWLAAGDIMELEIEGDRRAAQHHRTKGSSDMAYVVSAKWTAKEGKEDRLAGDHARDDRAVARRARQRLLPGASVDPENPRLFFLYEQYADEAGYEAHHGVRALHAPRQGRGDPGLLEAREREFYETL